MNSSYSFAPREQPVGEPLVQLAAARLRRAAVGDVANQDVVEPQLLLAREDAPVRVDQPAADQRPQVLVRRGSGLGRAGARAPP